MRRNPGSIDNTIYFKLVNTTTGQPETGLDVTTLTMSYLRDRATRVGSVASALALVTTAHTDYGMIEVDSTNIPGLYRADFPDAAFASGSDAVQLSINSAAIDVAIIEVELNVIDGNTIQVSGTTQTANDNGADINTLIDRIIGTIAAGTHQPQSGDSFTRIGAAGAGLTDINLPDQIMNIVGDITGNLSGSVNSITNPVATDAASRNASKADVSAIPTNPLLTDDIRLNNLDASIASRSTFNPASDDVAKVTECTTNTDMRGTDGAITSLAGIATETKQDTIISNIDTMQVDITLIRAITAGSWAFINNQWIIYNELGTEVKRYNMTKDGLPNTDAPDARTLV